MKGTPGYSNVGRATLSPQVELKIADEWKSIKDIGKELQLTWSDHKLDLSSVTEVTDIRITFEATFDLSNYEVAYSLAKVEEDVVFVVRQWNVGPRTRKIKTGKIQKVPRTKKLQCNLNEMTLTVREFSGELELQPLLISKKRMHDRKFSSKTQQVYVEKAGILGWTDPITVILNRARAGVNSLFEFKWVSFANDNIPGLDSGEFFAMRWDARPVLYLNKDIDGLESVLTSVAGTGKMARARDAINSIIAHQAISVAVSSTISKAHELRATMDPSFSSDEIFEELSELEKLVVRSWVGIADPDASGSAIPYAESFERIINLDSMELQRAIVEVLPQRLQTELGSTKATAELLKQMMEQVG